MQIKISTSSMEPREDPAELIKELRRSRLAYMLNHLTLAIKSLETVAASGSVKRALMGFDQLNRLSAKSGKSKKQEQVEELVFSAFPNDPKYWEVLEQTTQAASRFYHQLMGIKQATGEVATGLDHTTLSGNLVSRMLGAVGQAAQSMVQDASLVRQGIQGLNWDLGQVGTAAEESSDFLKRAWGPTGGWFHDRVYSPIRADIFTLWDGMEPETRQMLQTVKGLLTDVGGEFSRTFTDAWNQVEGVFNKGGTVFEGLKGGVLSGFRNMVNNLISGINNVVVEPFSGINNLFAGLKNFTIGSLKPFKNLNFYIPMPQIPYLAQGAVLPANKPFMAVVGDQKHGTNIEAPLDVIRQAMADVLAESVDAQLAGHSATVEVLKQILAAVLGISIDEGTLCRAVEHHRQRLAVMTGGY